MPRQGEHPNGAVLIAVFFAICWGAVKATGIDSLSSDLNSHWQFLDLQELARAPLDSLLSLHAQPPLLNILALALIELSGDPYQGFVVVNALCTAVTALCIFKAVRAYTRSSAIPLATACAYTLSPATLLYVAYPLYPCLTALGYATLAYSFLISGERPRTALLVLSLSICHLCLLRSSFTILHVLFFFSLVIFLIRRRIGKKVLLSALALVLAVSLAIPLKNEILYGFFGTSSWAPLNIAKGVGIPAPLGYFPSPELLHQKRPDLKCENSYGFQDSALKKHNGEDNFNSCLFIEYAKQMKANLHAAYSPAIHARLFLSYADEYLSFPDRYAFLTNRQGIESYAHIADALFLPINVPRLRVHDIRLLVLLSLALAAWLALTSRDRFIGFLLVLFCCHFASHTLTDGAESKRFVFDIEFIFYIFLAAGAVRLGSRFDAPLAGMLAAFSRLSRPAPDISSRDTRPAPASRPPDRGRTA